MYDPLIVSVMDRVARDLGDDVEIWLDGRYRLGQPHRRTGTGPEPDVLAVLDRALESRWVAQ